MEVSDVAGACAAFIIIGANTEKRKRMCWHRDFLKNGTSHGDILMSELLLNDSSSFHNLVRLTKSDFEEFLCLLIAPKISKKNTN